MKVGGALLAGGRSTRMGRDKALLPWNTETAPLPLYRFQLEKLIQAIDPKNEASGIPIFLSANRSQKFAELPERVIRVDDPEEDAGPLAGLVACLETCKSTGTDALLALAVDLPEMPVSFLRQLISEADRRTCGIIPLQDSGDEALWEPLVAVYPLAILQLARNHLNHGILSLQKLAESARGAGLIEPHEITGSERPFFANVNTPEELSAALQSSDPDRETKILRFRSNPVGSSNQQGPVESVSDHVAAEEPLEIRVEGRSIAVAMRTPGHDEELAAGFLFTEGVVSDPGDIFEISRCPDLEPEAVGNVIEVLLTESEKADLDSLTRHVFTSSSCGVCGKATIESVFQNFPPVDSNLTADRETILALPNHLRAAQDTFERTGGLHASALFDAGGDLKILREDVGRHNALDKVIGRSVLDGNIPLKDRILLVSGRISFELIQKALAAGIPMIAGISAPSSLAVQFAKQSGQTLVGFLRESGFNVYSGEERISED